MKKNRLIATLQAQTVETILNYSIETSLPT